MARKQKPVIFQLPLPPSVNRLNVNRAGPGRGRTTSTEVIAWRQAAGVALSKQGRKVRKIEGPVVIICNFERPSPRADLDNRVKILFDFLVKKELIDEDRNVTAFSAAWLPKPSLSEPTVQIGIYPAGVGAINLEFMSTRDGHAGAWIHQLAETVT